MQNLNVLDPVQLNSFQMADLILKLGDPRPMRIDYLFLLLLDHQVRQLQLRVTLVNFLLRLSLVPRVLALKFFVLLGESLQPLGDTSSVITVFKDIDVPFDEFKRAFMLL